MQSLVGTLFVVLALVLGVAKGYYGTESASDKQEPALLKKWGVGITAALATFGVFLLLAY